MTTHAFNDEDALPTQENAFSARGEAPRRGGSAVGTSSKSGAMGKMIVLAVGVVLIVGGVGLVYLKNARPAQTVVSAPSPEVYPNDVPASGALAGEEELLFASSVDGAAAAGLDAVPVGAPALTAPQQAMPMTPPDVARIDPVMAEAMQQATIEAAGTLPPPESPDGAPTPITPQASSTNSDALLQRIALLEASLGRLTAEVDTLDKDLNLVESQMPALRAQVRQTTPPRAAPRSTAPPARPPAPAPAVAAAATPQGFKLKAVLDGQAWIEGRDGQTYTVRAGDNIDGLGVVVEIDAVRNEVRFPAGVTLNFR